MADNSHANWNRPRHNWFSSHLILSVSMCWGSLSSSARPPGCQIKDTLMIQLPTLYHLPTLPEDTSQNRGQQRYWWRHNLNGPRLPLAETPASPRIFPIRDNMLLLRRCLISHITSRVELLQIDQNPGLVLWSPGQIVKFEAGAMYLVSNCMEHIMCN